MAWCAAPAARVGAEVLFGLVQQRLTAEALSFMVRSAQVPDCISRKPLKARCCNNNNTHSEWPCPVSLQQHGVRCNLSVCVVAEAVLVKRVGWFYVCRACLLPGDGQFCAACCAPAHLPAFCCGAHKRQFAGHVWKVRHSDQAAHLLVCTGHVCVASFPRVPSFSLSHFASQPEHGRSPMQCRSLQRC